ncbi:MAG: maleylpyruvate isomerase N-terminal domain-containing protein, partial [Acidimicrobiales bacterium]
MPADTAAALAGCAAADDRLRRTLHGLDDGAVARPSLLPGWTVGHVLTHLARNADSHVRVLTAAREGRAVEQYPGGGRQREQDIDAGAGRPTAEIVEDVRHTTAALEASWAAMTADDWQAHGLSGGTPWPCAEMPGSRWREVEVHHADLGLAYTPADWPDDFVVRELPLALAGLDRRVGDAEVRRRLLAWLLGRGEQPSPVALDRLPPSGGLYR